MSRGGKYARPVGLFVLSQSSYNMPFAVNTNLLLLPLRAVRLGRFVKCIEQPLEGYHKPPLVTPPLQPMSELDYAAHDQWL
jgi:hypothetical protein